MKLLHGLVILGCVLTVASGCRRNRSEAVPPPATPTAPTTPASPAASAATSTALVPDVPFSSQPKVGEPMPPIVSEMLLSFEARFGRPPTNYTELSRLKSELPKK